MAVHVLMSNLTPMNILEALMDSVSFKRETVRLSGESGGGDIRGIAREWLNLTEMYYRTGEMVLISH